MKNTKLTIKTREMSGGLKEVAFTYSHDDYTMNSMYFANVEVIDFIIDEIVNKALRRGDIDVVIKSTNEHFLGCSVLINIELTHDEYILKSVADMIFNILVFHGYCNNRID